ncbi:heparan sulfate 2-O-sulfotransferase 1-like [Tachypleus tridentatus]|uniref:heparan sulfate 2-O-sulfotransferase 1-like n=1 Tax=Tachypleus tridentatus TaxID=6853 RepID=UPI003FD4318C
MWQIKQFIILLGVIVFTALYCHFIMKVSHQDEAIERLAATISQLKLRNFEDSKTDILSEFVNNGEDAKSPFDDLLIIYNRVPKTASTSLMGVIYDLCKRNKFHVLHINTTRNVHVMSLSDQRRFIENVTSWQDKKPALYHGHIAFLNFQRYGISQKPIYINLIRKPLDRLVSYYYFLRYGDDFRPYVVRKRKGNTVTFDECVERQESDCDPENMWLQIPFFCGLHVDCWEPGNDWALAQAKQNLVEHYMVVGVTEELEDFVALLEAVLPRFFHGATQQFLKGKKSHLRKTYNKIDPVPETVHKIKSSKIWIMENDFYEFALKQFHAMKKRTLIEKRGVFEDGGQRFFFEKIRPR